MGVWGSTLYANDTTLDVRDAYMDYLKEQLSNEEALQKTLLDFEELMGDEDEEALFWFALAETQWKVGRLTPEVKENALRWIEEEGGVALWEESKSGSAGWKKTLEKLKEKLESPMSSEKKVRKPELIDQNLWNIGDVYVYQFHTEKSKEHGTCGKYVLLQKMGASPLTSGWPAPERIFMMIHVFNKLFDDMPTLKDMEGVRLLPMSETVNEELLMSRLMELNKKKHYPKAHLTFLGNASVPSNKKIMPSVTPVYWNEIEEVLNYCFSKFQDKEYEEIDEGIFSFKE